MFFKKKRKIEAVTKRTEDTVPFVVPQIESKEEKAGYKANRFISPIFGTKVKDEVVIPTPYSRTGDLDRQLDSFRTKKKLTKEVIIITLKIIMILSIKKNQKLKRMLLKIMKK